MSYWICKSLAVMFLVVAGVVVNEKNGVAKAFPLSVIGGAFLQATEVEYAKKAVKKSLKE